MGTTTRTIALAKWDIIYDSFNTHWKIPFEWKCECESVLEEY